MWQMVKFHAFERPTASCTTCAVTEIDLLIFIERLSDNMYWNDPDGFFILLPLLAQVGDPNTYFIVRMHVVLCEPIIKPLPVIDENLEHAACGSHKVAAYVDEFRLKW